MNIIIYHFQNGILYNSLGNKFTNNFFEALLSQKEKDTIQCFYNLDFSVANLVKDFTESEIKQLWISVDPKNPEDKPENHGKVSKGKYIIDYFPQALFTINTNKDGSPPFCILSDMSQYMDSKVRSDFTEGDIYSKLFVAKGVAEQVYKSLVKLGLNPKSLVSPIKAYQNSVLSRMSLPTYKDMPEEAVNYYYNACYGGWVETRKKGHFDKIYSWDIRSCYPSKLRNLIDFRKGTWGKVDSVPNHKAGMLGIFNVMAEIEADLHCIFYRDELERNYTPTGTYPSVVTWNKLLYADYHRWGKFNVKDGWVWTPKNGTVSYPLRAEMDWLYEKKGKSEDDIERNVIKRVMNGVSGLLTQKQLFKPNEPFGKYFNPCWRAEVENNTHLSVVNFCIENKIDPVAIMTDGVETDVDLKINSSTAMGNWKLDSATKGLVIGSGLLALQGKQKDGDFSLNYDSLIQQINDNPMSKEIVMEKEGFVSIGEAVERNMIDKLGQFIIDKRSILLDSDTKRFYVNEPDNFGELLNGQFESMAIDASMLGE